MALTGGVDLAQAGPQNTPDGQAGAVKSDNYGNITVAEVQGKYLEWTRRGYVFTALTTVTGVAIPGVGSTTTYPMLWNQGTSSKIVVPLILQITPIYLGAVATVANVPVGGFCFASVTSAGNAINASYISAFTASAPGCMALGKANAVTQWSASATIGTAGVLTRILDFGGAFYTFNATAAMALGSIVPQGPYDFQGFPILPPGTAIALCQTATAAATVVYNISFTFAEIPNQIGF
jgi:hypothetical protein